MAYPVLLDTCVLFPMYLRDSLLRLAIAELYEPLWSQHILDELSGALVREHMASDRHVLAAAVKSGAVVLASDNVADFPSRSTEPYGIEVLTADQFLLDLLDAAPATGRPHAHPSS